jgi:hypothetical protein
VDDARVWWQGWIMAEARYPDVWQSLSLDEILREWAHVPGWMPSRIHVII